LTGDFEPCSDTATQEEVDDINEAVLQEVAPKVEFKITDFNNE